MVVGEAPGDRIRRGLCFRSVLRRKRWLFVFAKRLQPGRRRERAVRNRAARLSVLTTSSSGSVSPPILCQAHLRAFSVAAVPCYGRSPDEPHRPTAGLPYSVVS